MTLRDPTAACFQHPTVRCCLPPGSLAAVVSVLHPVLASGTHAAIAAATVVVYLLACYALHRCVPLSRWMFKSRFMARIWKRIRYNGHVDPTHLEARGG